MAIAAARNGDQRRAVAVIGDGAMSAGMAFEALNHAGSLPIDLLVVLNDNDMSISENVGALSNYLARVISGRLYAQLREGGKKALQQMPAMRELARRSEEHVKGMVLPGTLFEEMGFNYVGPIDGHDLQGAAARAAQHPRAVRPAAAARGDAQGQGLRAGRGRSDHLARPRPVRSGQRHHPQGKARHAELLAGVRPVAVRHGRARPAHHRHHAGDARRLGPGGVLASAFPSATSTSPSPSSTP